MKKLLLLLCAPLLLSCGENEKELEKDLTEDILNFTVSEGNSEKKTSAQKGFILSEEFIKADDELFLSLLIDAQSLVNMSDSERSENLIRWKENTQIYVKDDNVEENIVINKSNAPGPTQSVLDFFKEQVLIECTLINSGFGKYQDKFEYIFIEKKCNFGEFRYSIQYVIAVNNENYHIVINTKEGLEINDVFTEIN